MIYAGTAFAYIFKRELKLNRRVEMAKKCTWLVLAVLAPLMVNTVCLAAQAPKTGDTLVSLSKRGDTELNQLRGQGASIDHRQINETVAAIKLWDEWLRPQAPMAPNNLGQNQVTLSGPRN